MNVSVTDDDMGSEHSAIDGFGKEMEQWQFLRQQFLKSNSIVLDTNKFLDSEIGLSYLIEEMGEQGLKNPVNDDDIGVHYQQHLEGWRYGLKPDAVNTMSKFMGHMSNF